MPYLARMANLLARRAASVASTGGGVVEISSSGSGSGSFWGSGCAMRDTAGDCVRDKTDTSAELCRGEILEGTLERMVREMTGGFATLTRLLPSPSQRLMVSGTRNLACPDGVSVLNANPCRLDRNREVRRACGTVGDPSRVCNLVHVWIDRLGLCGWTISSCPHSDTRLSNPWDHPCP